MYEVSYTALYYGVVLVHYTLLHEYKYCMMLVHQVFQLSKELQVLVIR